MSVGKLVGESVSVGGCRWVLVSIGERVGGCRWMLVDVGKCRWVLVGVGGVAKSWWKTVGDSGRW